MARFKHYDYKQSKMLPIDFDEQIIPGSFEHTLCYLVDHELDLSVFDAHYKNEEFGAPAYDPAILLKIVLASYARGITSSRQMERLCRENIVFMALSADSQPHFTTIANFISSMHDVIEVLFSQLIAMCSKAGLIGGDLFAIDGCKLPSSASKEWSGTQADYDRKYKKINRAVRRMLKKHREEDEQGQVSDHTRRAAEEKQIKKLQEVSRKIKKHCKTSTDKIGQRGRIIQSNITDNDSAKMKTSHGVIQGYIGVSAADKKHQVIISAQAFGEAQEHQLLEPIVEQAKQNLSEKAIQKSKLTADAGFHNTANIQYCQDQKIDAYIADNGFRKRDWRFKDYGRYKEKVKPKKRFSPEAFRYDEETEQCTCPAGQPMWLSRPGYASGGYWYKRYEGYLNTCKQCPLQKQCMTKPVRTHGRTVTVKLGDHGVPPTLSKQMQDKLDSDKGRQIYSQRIGAVEPVFGNITVNKRLNRFTLRGKKKVNAQWLMWCMVHNIEKLQKYGQIT
jgi:transposase